MMTWTEPGDTAASITARVLGRPDTSYADKLLAANQTSYAYMLMQGSGFYAPYRAIWLPEYSRIDEDPMKRNVLLHRMDVIPSYGRQFLYRLQKQGIDLNELVGAGKCVQEYNRLHYDEGADIIEMLQAETPLEITHRVIERASYPAEQFAHHMHKLNTQLKALVNARGTSHEAITSARAAYRQAYKEATIALNKGAQLYARHLSKHARKYLQSAKHSELMAYKKGIFINDLADVEVMGNIAEYGKMAGRTCFIFSAVLGASEVYHAFKEHEDWIAKMVGEAGAMAIIGGVGRVLLLFTPEGWVLTICVGVAEGIGLSLGTKWIADQLEYAAHWIHENLRKWL